MTITELITARLSALDFDGLAELYRPDAITEHLNYCTGVWDAATIARQAVEAPMVRR